MKINVAILTAVVAMPLVIAAGFLSGQMRPETSLRGGSDPPNLRGTFQPDAIGAGPARMRSTL